MKMRLRSGADIVGRVAQDQGAWTTRGIKKILCV